MRSARVPTGKDVARLARVTPSTVSLVLSGRATGRRVSDPTRARILKAARRLGYRPNLLAASLRTRQSRHVGLVVRTFEHPHQGHLNELLINELKARGYSVLVAFTGRLGNQAEFEELYRHQPAGILTGPLYHERPPPFVCESFARRFPVVGFESMARLTVDTVNVDMPETIRLSVRHLQEQGHRRIGLSIFGPWPSWERAYLDELRRREPAWRPVIRYYFGSHENGLKLAASVALGRNQPTAYVLHDERLAAGFLRGLWKRGIRVPGDVAFAVLSSPWMGSVMPVSFTCVHPDPAETAREAVRLLARRIEGDWDTPRQCVVIPNRLTIGESSARPDGSPS